MTWLSYVVDVLVIGLFCYFICIARRAEKAVQQARDQLDQLEREYLKPESWE